MNTHQIIEDFFGVAPDTQLKFLYSFVIILVFWVILRLLKKFVVEKIDDMTVRYQWQKIVQYSTVFIALLFLTRVWFGGFGSLATYFGLLSAGLAIAFKDLLVNLVGWIFIMIRKPLRVGDRVQIGDVTGDVIDVRIFQFSVMEVGNWVDADQSTGRIIHIPNGMVFTKTQANYTAGFEYIWNEIPVLVTFESDWKLAKQILTEAVTKHGLTLSTEAAKQIKEAAKQFLIFYTKLTPRVYTSVKDSGVLLTIRYLCHARQRRGTEESIWEEILEQFAKHDDIDFAYPTKRFYNNESEGKPGTKPK
ncbi:MAG: mechanosensitive ion channel family protein [Melioribacteraceae bacterium]|nr:mechanosensitive ion channel family protein [Melioribacteraceae bacterium]MCF8354973.1 mechanosensitive ion channel family protein [Melioribacteraceae bacterium]MCF8394010.1 mechanosensitive ion channel family protein [Melioribacteraceae bacterium]MCF8419787.1 mechanosensitive ion channel family protein [Melioribacteraceae bacterium]